MDSYGVRDVERLLKLSRRTIRALVDAGFVEPSRGPRNALVFSFRDLVVLRTAQSLVGAKVPHRRIVQAVRALRKRLPATMPLSGLSIDAVGERVVVREGATRWQPESGQYLLAFEPGAGARELRVVESVGDVRAERASSAAREREKERDAAARADAAFELGVEAEHREAFDEARRAYRAAIAADPCHVDARINLGRLLHDAGRLAEAEATYRDAFAACGEDALLWFNLAVLLDDASRFEEAIAAYRSALALDATLADAHYNLALLFDATDRKQEAIRHLGAYRRLVKK